ncbi:vWA domain-containing protein [Phreatobacter sp.]|uniref:vWA domain-containing protein n=1 Tax=Phreatobacter sp. TaxID=1966341 RepID=UPI003F6F939D
MSATAERPREHRATLARIARGLRMVTVPLPHLSGLAAAVRVDIDERVPTMGVFASGRLVANPAFTARLSDDDLVFVLAHELLHLALRTHDRAKGSGQLEFNYAHDYIINDTLRHALGVAAIPAGGLDMPGAREKSAEEIVLDMRRNGQFMQSRSQVWEGRIVSVRELLDAAAQAPDGATGDVMDAAREREMFPGDATEAADRARAIRDLAARGMALAKAIGSLRGRGTHAGGDTRNVRALRGLTHAPWQSVMQTWLEGASPGERTYTRISRRSADPDGEMVLPGRRRHSWILNVVLDTSASMADDIPVALGALADFSEAVGIDIIRIVQCDTVVTSDEELSSSELAEYAVKGYGGSDMTPALLALAGDPRVTAAVVITDGEISFPSEAPPYALLWALPRPMPSFQPPYGRVVIMQRGDTP